jgi:very-short-patch-repair endonuclease
VEAVEVVRRLGGTGTYGVVVAHATRGSLRQAVTDGRLLRAAHGVYALPALPPEHLASVVGGVLSHLSAAKAHELTIATPATELHVTLRPGARPVVPPGVRLHWSRLGDDEAEGGATTVLRTVLDCAVTLPFGEALAVADSAMLFLTGSTLLTAAYAQPPRRRARCVQVAEAADGRSANAFESLTRAALIEGGVGGFEPQVPVLLPNFTAHVDLADVRRRIAVEADSFTYHATRDAFSRDFERYNELVAAGWLVLRVSWEQVRFRPEWVADVVRRARRLREPPVRRYFATPRSPCGVSRSNDELVVVRSPGTAVRR